MYDQLTIALPVYKRTDYVKEALDSAVNQTVPCKILLVDNNSPHDDFKTIVDSYNNPNITYVKTDETVPQDENFNNCFRFAETKWVTVLHDDDMLHCQYVEFSRELIDKYGDSLGGIVYQSNVGDKVWAELGTKRELTADIRKLNPAYFYFRNLVFPSILVKKDRAMKMGGFNKDLHPIADYDFWYRYSMEEQFFFVNQQMAYYRVSPTQSTNHLIEAMINNIYAYMLREVRKSKHDNVLSRLAVEYSRIENIQYFTRAYPNLIIPDEIIKDPQLLKAKKKLKPKWIQGILRRYTKQLSFSSV